MIFEFPPVIIWYLFFVALGWGTFPLAYTCFRHFPDRGFALAKTQGIFLISYLIWISISSGFTYYYRSSITWILFLYLIINGILLVSQFRSILGFVKTRIKLFLLIEGIFLVFFLGCVLIRMYNPDLTGAEKEADFTFLNAILHSKTFPPKDTWFAGSSINYYYFGYLVWATAIKFTKIISPIGFNLALAAIVALSAVGAFGLVYHFTRRVSYGIISSFFLCVLGNLDGLVQIFEKSPLFPLYKGGNVFPFDWWRSSRVIPDTINEFPYFSFLLGDLHAHFMAIPFVLLLLGLLSQFVFYFSEKIPPSLPLGEGERNEIPPNPPLGKAGLLNSLILLRNKMFSSFRRSAWERQHRRSASHAAERHGLHSDAERRNENVTALPLGKGGTVYSWILLSFISLSLGGTAVINGWDYPTCLIIAGLCVGIAVLRMSGITRPGESKIRRILMALLMFGFLIVFSRVFFLPFYHHFIPQLSFSNLRFVTSTQRTGIGYFLIIYGLFLWIILFFMYCKFHWLFMLPSDQEKNVKLVYWNGILLLSVLGYLVFSTWVLPLSCIVSGVFLYLLYKESLIIEQPATSNQQPALIPYFLLFMTFAIITGCEIVYIKDFYGHPLERQNTIFKFYYQAWILLSIGTPYLLYLISRKKCEGHRSIRRAWSVIFILLCCSCCIYPIFATYEKTNHFRGEAQGGLLYIPTLNGISYIAYRHPYEYEALMWIQENIDEDAVILEATGKPYSFFGRVATMTGRSTVLGWGNHEALWRDQTWKSIIQRTEEIKQLYETVDKQSIMGVLQKYNVNYIYIGELEKETYNSEGLEAFDQYFPLVFENRFVKIYKIS